MLKVKTPLISGFAPVFKIQGKVYHLIGSLLPPPDDEHKFVQIYFMNDEEERIDARLLHNELLRPHIIEELQEFFEQNNSYAKSFKYALKNMSCDSLKVI